MRSAVFREGIVKAILQCNQINLADLDQAYENFSKVRTTEINKYISIADSCQQTKKRFKNHKPFRNEELTFMVQ